MTGVNAAQGTAGREALYDTFAANATIMGAEVYRVAGPREARDLITRLIRGVQAARVAVAPAPLLAELDVVGAVGAAGAGLTTGSAREQAESADLGITACERVIAETGTLVQEATALDRRLVGMLPPVHLAVVPATGLTKSWRELLAELAGGDLPGYLAFISGPSRTADIERVLTIGVHGPGRLLVVVVDQEGGEGR